MVKNNRITAYSGIVLELGKVGENGAVQIVFPAEKILEEYGAGGSFRILNQWPDGDLAYPVQAELQGSNVIWTVSSKDVPCAGTGKCELQYIAGDRIVKSETWKTRTLASLGEYDEAPEAAQRWQEEIMKAAARAEKAEQAVESARKDAAGSAGRARTAAEQAAENSERATQSARNAQEQATMALVAAANAETAAAAAEEKAEQAADDAAAAKTKTDAMESTVRGLSMTSSQLVSGMQSVWEQLASDESRLEAVEQTAAGKQDKLIAGANITISGNVISASGGSGGGYDDTELRNRIGAIEDDLSELPEVLGGYNDRLLDHESRIQELEAGGESEVFVAEYRVATLEQVTEALANGKVVVGEVTMSGQTYYHWNLRESSLAYYFYTFYNNASMRLIKIDKATGAWSSETYDIPTAATVDAQIDAKLAAIPFAEGVGF